MNLNKLIGRIRFLFYKPNNLVAIIIPIYRDVLDNFENIAFTQCIKILNRYPIYLILPTGLKPSFLDELLITEIKTEHFPSHFFDSVSAYSQLLVSKEFYERFLEFKFILIHQLDAFVFQDQLVDWCQKNYDYIGAPWMDVTPLKPHIYWKGWYYQLQRIFRNKEDLQKPKVGNGGFSLRKVKSHLLAIYLLRSKAWNWNLSEDIFWGGFVPGNVPFFKLASLDDARRFAFETNPQKCYEDNDNQLPFGCHAWSEIDIEFWRPFINNCGFSI